MNEQDIIKGSVWHVLNFLTLTVMEYAFTLAFERELVTDDRYNNMAGDTWGSMYYEVHGNSYEELLEDGACMYVALGYVIYTCACQLNYQKEDVYDQADEEYCDRMMDVLDGLVKMEDGKAQLLIDLIADIQQEALKISDCGNDG